MNLRNCNLCLVFIAITSALLLSACSGTADSFLDELELPKFGSREDGGKELAMPPGLYAPPRESRYDVPGSEASMKIAAMSDYVLPQRLDMHLRREGNNVWLSVDLAPVELWQHIRSFWVNYGFRIANENPAYGSMETDWLEQIVGSGGDIQIRDKFITRLERDSNAVTNIYVVNRKNMLRNGRPEIAFSDTETETSILYDLMSYLSKLKGNQDPKTMPTLEEIQLVLDIEDNHGIPTLTIGHPYARVWRLLGSALNRADIEIVNADRSRRIYLVRHRAVNDDAFVNDYDATELLQLYLLPSDGETLITAHKNHSNQAALPYEVAHSVLKRIVDAY